MIIDVHNHITLKGNPFYIPQEEYLKTMDELGIDKMVILGKDYGKLGDRQKSNLPDEEVATFVKAYPDRFIGFTAVHPDREIKKNVERVERAVNDLGLKGIKLNPASGFYPNDERLYPVYEKAEELKIPVMVHSGIKPPGEGNRMKYCEPIFLDDVAVDFPELNIIVAHAGYPWLDETIIISLYAQNVFVDISTLNQIEEVIGWEVIYTTLRKLKASIGPNRILFGSDGIFNLEKLLQAIKSADFLTENEKEKILGRNAEVIIK